MRRHFGFAESARAGRLIVAHRNAGKFEACVSLQYGRYLYPRVWALISFSLKSIPRSPVDDLKIVPGLHEFHSPMSSTPGGKTKPPNQ